MCNVPQTTKVCGETDESAIHIFYFCLYMLYSYPEVLDLEIISIYPEILDLETIYILVKIVSMCVTPNERYCRYRDENKLLSMIKYIDVLRTRPKR